MNAQSSIINVSVPLRGNGYETGNITNVNTNTSTSVSVPLRGNGYETEKNNSHFFGKKKKVSVPLRGNGYETITFQLELSCDEALFVSVPLRGNGYETSNSPLCRSFYSLFPSPCGEMGMKPLPL